VFNVLIDSYLSIFVSFRCGHFCHTWKCFSLGMCHVAYSMACSGHRFVPGVTFSSTPGNGDFARKCGVCLASPLIFCQGCVVLCGWPFSPCRV
jgi:hypothetical protein